MSQTKYLTNLSVMLFLCLVAIVSYAGNSLESGKQKLTVFVQTVITFKADFEQTVFDAQGNVMETATGFFALERPGKFRWDYQQPYPQHIVADGERIWFYDVDLEQVTVKSQQDALSNTPATLLSGELLPEEKYQVTNIQSQDGLTWVRLIPKDSEANFQLISLAFKGNNLSTLVMRDSFDQQTQLVFTNVEENSVLPVNKFVFTTPEGVDVVGDSAL